MPIIPAVKVGLCIFIKMHQLVYYFKTACMSIILIIFQCRVIWLSTVQLLILERYAQTIVTNICIIIIFFNRAIDFKTHSTLHTKRLKPMHILNGMHADL